MKELTVTVGGAEGAGKTTLLRALIEFMTAHGLVCTDKNEGRFANVESVKVHVPDNFGVKPLEARP